MVKGVKGRGTQLIMITIKGKKRRHVPRHEGEENISLLMKLFILPEWV